MSRMTPAEFAANLDAVRVRIAAAAARAGREASEIELLPVSKTVPQERLRAAIAAGCTTLGENKVQEAVRKHDTAARLGGDEFVVILDPVASSDEAAQIAERLVESIGQPCALATGTATIGASIGIALFSGQGEESDEQLLRNADKAMYDAKAEGKNRYRIYLPPAVGVPAPR